MNFREDNLYHIFNQGNNKQQIFFEPEDYLIFLRKWRLLVSAYSETIAYCLMPNHFHFMVYLDNRINNRIKQGDLILDHVTNGIRKLLSGYTRIINAKYGRSGSLFRQKTKYKCLSDMYLKNSISSSTVNYYENCFNYIHQNPIKARLVNNLEEWEYSSFKDYAGLRNGSLCNKKLALKYCSYDQSNFIQNSYEILRDELNKFT
jgi:putative transposase